MKKIILINLLLCSFIWALNIPKTSTFDKKELLMQFIMQTMYFKLMQKMAMLAF